MSWGGFGRDDDRELELAFAKHFEAAGPYRPPGSHRPQLNRRFFELAWGSAVDSLIIALTDAGFSDDAIEVEVEAMQQARAAAWKAFCDG